MQLVSAAQEIQPELVRLRHQLHRKPEVGLHLPLTQATVLQELAGLGLEISLGQKCSSITAVLRGTATDTTHPAPSVLLRADMDALPITEKLAVPYRSEHEGCMHACGHDLHTTMLVGAGRLLSARREQLSGDVIFMFQPGEEGHNGAQVMLDEGILDASGRKPDAAWAIHVLSGRMSNGQFTGRPGPTMSASNELHVTVHGAGGHGAAPHTAQDPIPAAIEMISGLHALMGRIVSPFDPVVLTVGKVNAGTQANIIPSSASFSATVRCFNETLVNRLEEATLRYCNGVAAAHGLTVDARFERQYPVTVNAPESVELAKNVVGELLGSERWQDLQMPSMGSEDFSRILEVVPGALLFLGASTDGDDWASSPENHSPISSFDDSVLHSGASVLAGLAIRSLNQ